MRMGASTQLRRRIMENNHGFAFGESNSSAVKWSVSELENDLKTDEHLLSTAAEQSIYPDPNAMNAVDLTLDDHRNIQKNKLLFTKTKDDLINEERNNGTDLYSLDGVNGRNADGNLMNDAGTMMSFDDTDKNAMWGDGEEQNGLDEDESNWLDNIGLQGAAETNAEYMVSKVALFSLKLLVFS